MSLQEVLKRYQTKRRQRQKDIQTLRGQIDRGIEEVTIKELKLQNHKVNHIHKNQQAIEVKLRKQQQLISDLRKNEEIWASLYQQLNRALMQVGDLVHYAGYIEAEVGEILGVASVAKFLQQAQNGTENAQQQEKKVEQPQLKIAEQSQAYQQIVEQEKHDSTI